MHETHPRLGFLSNTLKEHTSEHLAVFEKGYVEYAKGKVVKNGEEVNLGTEAISNSGINLSSSCNCISEGY